MDEAIDRKAEYTLSMTFCKPSREPRVACVTKRFDLQQNGSFAPHLYDWTDDAGKTHRRNRLGCKLWSITDVRFTTAAEGARLLIETATERDEPVCLVPGRLPEGMARNPRTERNSAALPRRSSLVAFDLDGVPVPLGMERATVAEIGTALRAGLPAEWQRALCVVQLTSQHGLDLKAGWRARLYVFTDRPVTATDLAVLFYDRRAPFGASQTPAPALLLPWCNVRLDTSVWANAQPIYTANPIFKGPDGADVPDPIAERWHTLPGEGDGLVHVPAVDVIEARRIELGIASDAERPAVGDVTPEGMSDSPAVIARAAEYLAGWWPVLAGENRHDDAAKALNRAMDFGVSHHTAADMVAAVASERGDFDPGEDLTDYLRRRNPAERGSPIGCSYDPHWRPGKVYAGGGSFGAVTDDGPAGAALSPATRSHALQFFMGEPLGAGLQFVFDGLMPQVEFGMIYGESGSGKSFVMMCLAGAIATGQDFMGHENISKVSAGVLIIAAEAHSGLRRRRAALVAKGMPADAPLVTVALSDHTRLGEAVTGAKTLLSEQGYKLGFVFVDTFGQFFAMNSENDNAEMATVIRSILNVARDHGVMIVAIHHPAAGGQEPRGATTMKNALDWGLLIEGGLNLQTRKQRPRTVLLRKLKDNVDGHSFGFKIESVNIGQDADGEPIEAGFAVWTMAAGVKATTAKPVKLLAGQADIERILREHGPGSQAEILAWMGAAGLEPKRSTVARHVGILREMGRLVPDPAGRLALPEQTSAFSAVVDEAA